MLDLIFYLDNGTYNARTDLDCWVRKDKTSAPTVKSNEVDVPYANGTLELDHAFGDRVVYNKRQLSFPMKIMSVNADATFSRICRLINGKKIKVSKSTDPDYYYEGKANCGTLTSEKSQYKFNLTISAYPYKYKVNETVKNVVVTPEGVSIVCNNLEMPTVPTFTLNGTATIKFGNIMHDGKAGDNRWADIVFKEGDNTVELVGSNINATITYREGCQ